MNQRRHSATDHGGVGLTATEAVQLGFWLADQAVVGGVQTSKRAVRGARLGVDVLDVMAGCLP
jgi:hypothetical protein